MTYSCDKFESERELTKTASRSSYFKPLLTNSDFVEFEMEGLFGIPDLVVANVSRFGDVDSWAFEMKLSNWKRALRQAFRYKSFAQRSYVVMDECYVSRATRYLDWFREAKIGLLSVTRRDWVISYFHPDSEEPYSTELKNAFKERVLSCVQKEYQMKVYNVPQIGLRMDRICNSDLIPGQLCAESITDSSAVEKR